MLSHRHRFGGKRRYFVCLPEYMSYSSLIERSSPLPGGTVWFPESSRQRVCLQMAFFSSITLHYITHWLYLISIITTLSYTIIQSSASCRGALTILYMSALLHTTEQNNPERCLCETGTTCGLLGAFDIRRPLWKWLWREVWNFTYTIHRC